MIGRNIHFNLAGLCLIFPVYIFAFALHLSPSRGGMMSFYFLHVKIYQKIHYLAIEKIKDVTSK